jgi:hypothetical protein
MDAEIWSYADTKNGRTILHVLTIVILLKEITVGAMPMLGLPGLDPIFAAPPDMLPIAPGHAALLLKLALVLFLNLGFSWARLGLGLIYLITPAYAAFLALQEPLEPLRPVTALTLGNAALGFGLGLVLLCSAQLKAYLWRRAVSGLIIPIPSDDDPGGRPPQRRHTLGESVLAALRRFVSILVLIAILAAVAHLYGWTEPLLRAFGH